MPTYPFIFECVHCGRETTVKRMDALSACPNPDMLEAIDMVLASRGWVKCTSGSCCPDCAGDIADA